MTTDVSTNKLKINVLTRTQYDSAEKNNDELYFVEESETNTWLIAVTDVAPATANVNDRYYNPNTKLIYTWNGTAWTNAISPTPDDLYIDKSDNSTYAWDGTDLVQIGSTGGITTDDIDNETITLNESSKLQANGLVNQNEGKVYNWVGTKAEYDALEEIHDDWLYYITDDEYASGNMSLSNVYNRLNRAYAWTHRHVNGAGNVYNIGYANNGYIVSDAFPATKVIGTYDSGYTRNNYMICDGKLYYISHSGTTFTRTQIGTDANWTFVSSWWSNGAAYAINNGDLYTIATTTATLKNSGGWQKVSTSNGGTKLGIKNDSLYLIDSSHNVTEIDSSGVWSEISGTTSTPSYYMYGIKDGKLYSVSYTGVLTQISSDTTWTQITAGSNQTTGGGINNDALYYINSSGVKLINDTESWVKCCSCGTVILALTSTGKLYLTGGSFSSPTLTQIGTDTTWTDISGYASYALGVNNGNVYTNLGNPVQITTSGGISKVYGSLYSNASYDSAYFWTGSVTEDVHTVYTVPSPQTGFHTYANENLEPVSTITAVNMNNNTITDGLYTYTRDSAADKIFTAVSPDSKNQLVSMADILNAIKG